MPIRLSVTSFRSGRRISEIDTFRKSKVIYIYLFIFPLFFAIGTRHVDYVKILYLFIFPLFILLLVLDMLINIWLKVKLKSEKEQVWKILRGELRSQCKVLIGAQRGNFSSRGAWRCLINVKGKITSLKVIASK